MGSAYFDAHSWWQQCEKPLFTSLRDDLHADTCVIGAGIAGLTVAYELIKAGQSVVVLERERLGLGETALTSAHLSNALDQGYVSLQRIHGAEGAKLAAASHTEAINYIEQLQTQENMACDFQRVDGYLFLDPHHSVADLKEEQAAALLAGVRDVRLLDRAPVALFNTGPCLQFPRQAQFHPLRYLTGLAELVSNLGGRIFTHSEAVEVHGGANAYVTTRQNRKVSAMSIVVATNSPFNNRVVVHTKNPAYRSYLIGVTVPPDRVSAALFWDMADPYHYVRFIKDSLTDEYFILIGGEDHRTGQDVNPENHFAQLARWASERLDLPNSSAGTSMDPRTITRWSGQIMQSVDGLAFIGRNPADYENVFVVTGDHGHGLTHGTIAGMLLRDLILGQANPWQELYDPSRLHMRSLSTFVREATQSTVPYTDWLTEADTDSTAPIEAGEGAVVRDGLSKLAVYKDEVGRLHVCSAVCTHLGGLVRWNSAEKTWDCPCHGSRYDRFGQVINGPARAELTQVSSPLEPDAEKIEPTPL